MADRQGPEGRGGADGDHRGTVVSRATLVGQGQSGRSLPEPTMATTS